MAPTKTKLGQWDGSAGKGDHHQAYWLVLHPKDLHIKATEPTPSGVLWPPHSCHGMTPSYNIVIVRKMSWKSISMSRGFKPSVKLSLGSQTSRVTGSRGSLLWLLLSSLQPQSKAFLLTIVPPGSQEAGSPWRTGAPWRNDYSGTPREALAQLRTIWVCLACRASGNMLSDSLQK